MKFYIGLGGIGCRTLKDYAAANEIHPGLCFYIDTDPSAPLSLEETDSFFLFPGFPEGTALQRTIARNAIRKALFSGELRQFLSPLDIFREVSLCFFTSSFGGFGSVAVPEFIDCLESIYWERMLPDVDCEVYAYTEHYMASLGTPDVLMRQFSLGTADFSAEMANRDTMSTAVPANAMFLPTAKLHLIDTTFLTPAEFADAAIRIHADHTAYDAKHQYRPRVCQSDAQVFISYASADRVAADMLADALSERGITVWIDHRSIIPGKAYAAQIIAGIRNARIFTVLLSRNSIASPHVKNEIDRAFSHLRDGIRMIPFLLDGTEPDDECSYYLCRQQFINGQTPPLQARIAELVSEIEAVLNSSNA